MGVVYSYINDNNSGTQPLSLHRLLLSENGNETGAIYETLKLVLRATACLKNYTIQAESPSF